MVENPCRQMMRNDWEERARKDAFSYIASWQRKWDPEQFLQSGEADYATFVEPVLAALHFDPCGKTMLEVGCGVGRMTRSFARRFGHVCGLDISPEMLRQACALHEGITNIDWLLGDGVGLSMIRSDSQDFVFSYIVLHHLPTEDLALDYICEMLRVLKPGGVFLFHFVSQTAPTMNWRGRLVWGVIDRLHEPVFGIRLQKASDCLASVLGLDRLAAGKTWRGAVLDVRVVLETAWKNGGAVQGITGWGTTMTWCYGHKSGNRVAGAPDKPNQWLTALSAKDRS